MIVLQVATMLGSMLTKEEVDEFMREADVVRIINPLFLNVINLFLYPSLPISIYIKGFSSTYSILSLV